MEILVLAGIAGVILCGFLIKTKYEDSEFEKRQIQRAEEEKRHEEWVQKQYQVKDKLLNEIYEHLSERAKFYNWFAPVVSDIMLVLHERGRDSSELISSYRRSETAWASVKALLESEKKLFERNAVLRYELEYIKILIPEVENIVDFDEHKEKQIEVDHPSNYLSKDEYQNLSDTEKNKRALSYYKIRKNKIGNWAGTLKDMLAIYLKKKIMKLNILE
jgi:hypothetical protein